MRQAPSNRGGFTLAELLVVLVLATITAGSAVVVFINSNRVHVAQTAQIQAQQTARAGIDILAAELREVSNTGGDIIAIGPDSVSIRLMEQWTMVCDVDYPNSILTVMTLGPTLSVNDSIVLFAENDTLRLEDDAWLIGQVSAVSTAPNCVGGTFMAHEIDVSGMAGAMAVDTVRTGAPLRTFTHYTYGSYSLGGETYVGRRDSGGTMTPLVGPIRPGGLAFTFRDAAGATTTTVTDIALIDVSLAIESDVADTNNTQVRDSVFATFFVRN